MLTGAKSRTKCRAKSPIDQKAILEYGKFGSWPHGMRLYYHVDAQSNTANYTITDK